MSSSEVFLPTTGMCLTNPGLQPKFYTASTYVKWLENSRVKKFRSFLARKLIDQFSCQCIAPTTVLELLPERLDQFQVLDVRNDL